MVSNAGALTPASVVGVRDEVFPGSPQTVLAAVSVHIYDVNGIALVQNFNSLLYPLGLGAYHAGVEIFAKEYSFAYRGPGSVTGVFACSPRECPVHTYRLSVDMGSCHLAIERVTDLVFRLRSDWRSDRYNLLTRNCCHFADQFCKELGVGPLPSWVLSLAGGAALLAGFGRSMLFGRVDSAEERDKKFAEMDSDLMVMCNDDSPLKLRREHHSAPSLDPTHVPPERGYSKETFNGWHLCEHSSDWLYKPCVGAYFHHPTNTLWRQSVSCPKGFVQVEEESPQNHCHENGGSRRVSADGRALLRVCLCMWNWQVKKFEDMDYDLSTHCDEQETPITVFKGTVVQLL